MNAVIFNLRLLQSVLVGQVGAGEENSNTSLDFIPGSAIRGALAQAWRRSHDINHEDLAAHPDGARLFLSDRTRFLHAYPIHRLGDRMLPRPLSWRIQKGTSEDASTVLYDFAARIRVPPDPPGEKPDKPALPSGAFCWRTQDDIELVKPDRHDAAHNASDARMVKREGLSTVFRYDALAEGQVFGGVILADQPEDVTVLLALLNGALLSIGGSRSAGYGMVRIENAQARPNWSEYEPDDMGNGGAIRVTLLSDAIVRDPATGQWAESVAPIASGASPIGAYRQVHAVGGFNRTAGLPLPQALAIAAGSVFVFPAGSLSPALQKQWLTDGIGERRNEGYGRVAINWHVAAAFKLVKSRPPKPPARPALSAESTALAKRMANRLLSAEVEHRMLAQLSNLVVRKPPRNAQLSRLRIVTRNAKEAADIQKHIAELKTTARTQLHRAWIAFGDEKGAETRLDGWLSTYLKTEDLWKDFLVPPNMPAVAGQAAEANDALKFEYSKQFLDALFKRMSKLQESVGSAAHATEGGAK